MKKSFQMFKNENGWFHGIARQLQRARRCGAQYHDTYEINILNMYCKAPVPLHPSLSAPYNYPMNHYC